MSNSIPWEKFGLTELRTSDLGCFVSNPALWYIRYIEKIPSTTNAAMLRGLCVEKALMDHLKGLSLSKLIAEFEAELQKNNVEAVDETRNVELMTNNLINWWLDNGLPGADDLTYQEAISIQTDYGISINSFMDFKSQSTNRLWDVKTQKRLTHSLTHERQMGIYWKATQKEPSLVYVTPKHVTEKILPVERCKDRWREVEAIIRTMGELLIAAGDKERLARFIVPDFSHYTWDSTTKTRAKEIWYDFT